MSDDSKTMVESGLKSVQDKLEAAIKQYEGQLAENGNVRKEAMDAVKTLSTDFAASQAALTALGQKVADGIKGAEPRRLTPGDEVMNSEQYKALIAGNVQRVRIEIKNTVTVDGSAEHHGLPGTDAGDHPRLVRATDGAPGAALDPGLQEHGEQPARSHLDQRRGGGLRGQRQGGERLDLRAVQHPDRDRRALDQGEQPAPRGCAGSGRVHQHAAARRPGPADRLSVGQGQRHHAQHQR